MMKNDLIKTICQKVKAEGKVAEPFDTFPNDIREFDLRKYIGCKRLHYRNVSNLQNHSDESTVYCLHLYQVDTSHGRMYVIYEASTFGSDIECMDLTKTWSPTGSGSEFKSALHNFLNDSLIDVIPAEEFILPKYTAMPVKPACYSESGGAFSLKDLWELYLAFHNDGDLPAKKTVLDERMRRLCENVESHLLENMSFEINRFVNKRFEEVDSCLEDSSDEED